jgi:hypothetical protein
MATILLFVRGAELKRLDAQVVVNKDPERPP